MLSAAIFTALMIALAEVGDKSQLLTLLFATRYKARVVLAGIFMALIVLQAMAIVAGASLGAILPDVIAGIMSGMLFVFFGIWSIMGVSGLEESPKGPISGRLARFGPTLTVAGAFFLAELGDKTQLTTAFIASNPQAVLGALTFFGLTFDGGMVADTQTLLSIWVGSIAGMLAVNIIVLSIGRALGARLSGKLISVFAGVVFIAFGLYTIAAATFLT